MTRCHSASVISRNGARGRMAALLTTMSTVPISPAAPDDRVHVVPPAHVADGDDRAHAVLAGVDGHGLGVGAPAGGVHHDVTAAYGQRQHDGAADVAAGAGDDRRVPAKAGRRRHELATWPFTRWRVEPSSRITGGS